MYMVFEYFLVSLEPGPDMFLLISQRDNLLRYLPKEKSNVALNLKYSLQNIAMTRFDMHINAIYWLDIDLNAIYCLVGTVVHKLDLCKSDKADPTSFAIDHFSGILYWTDASDHSISFVRLSTPGHVVSCGIVYRNPSYFPTKLTTLPETGYVSTHIFVYIENQKLSQIFFFDSLYVLLSVSSFLCFSIIIFFLIDN